MKKGRTCAVLFFVLAAWFGGKAAVAGDTAVDPEDMDDIQLAPAGNGATLQYKTISDYMNAVVPEFLASNQGVGIAVGVIKDGQQQAYYFGKKAKGNGQAPDDSTIFMIGSITKTFTATLLAREMEKGLAHLGDPLQNYVPEGVTVPTFNGQPISLFSLATHTSGLPKSPTIPSGSEGNFTVAQLFDSLNQVVLHRAPGFKYVYSNYGFSLLGRALEKVGGATWETLVDQEITTPLGMVDTKADLTAEEIGRRAQGYNGNGNPAPYSMPGFPGGNPAGALYSTMNDMMKFLSYNMGLTTNSLNTLLPTLFHPRHLAGSANQEIGLAWQMLPLPGGNHQTVVWKGGSTPGFFAYIGFVPESKTGIVLLLNFPTKQMGVLALNMLKYVSDTTAPFNHLEPANSQQFQQETPIRENTSPVHGPGPSESH